jgi:hypothetical protein
MIMDRFRNMSVGVLALVVAGVILLPLLCCAGALLIGATDGR